MVSRLVIVGWAGWLVALVAAAVARALGGGGMPHVGAGILAAALVAFVHLALLVYLLGMRRVVAATARRPGFEVSWSLRYRRLTGEGLVWAAAGLALVGLVAGTGAPAYTGHSLGAQHGPWFLALALLEPLALLRLGAGLRRSEGLLVELGGALGPE